VFLQSGEFDHAPELELAPPSANARLGERAGEIFGLPGDAWDVDLGEAPDLFAQRGLFLGARFFESFDLLVETTKSLLKGTDKVSEALFPLFEFAPKRVFGKTEKLLGLLADHDRGELAKRLSQFLLRLGDEGPLLFERAFHETGPLVEAGVVFDTPLHLGPQGFELALASRSLFVQATKLLFLTVGTETHENRSGRGS
jgi:hypothetical protein